MTIGAHLIERMPSQIETHQVYEAVEGASSANGDWGKWSSLVYILY